MTKKMDIPNAQKDFKKLEKHEQQEIIQNIERIRKGNAETKKVLTELEKSLEKVRGAPGAGVGKIELIKKKIDDVQKKIEEFLNGMDKSVIAGTLIGAVAGGVALGVAGAVVGSSFGPIGIPIGLAIGTLVGLVAGGILGFALTNLLIYIIDHMKEITDSVEAIIGRFAAFVRNTCQ